MGMFEASFNAILYTLTLFLYWLKYRRIDLFFTIFAFFTIVSILGYLLIYHHIYNYDLSIINYLYLYFCVIIFIWPFRYANFTETNISISDKRGINALLIIFLITGSIALVYSIPKALALAALDNWKEVRNSVYSGAEIELYSSPFEKLMKNIYSYLSPFGIVMAFYQLTKRNLNYLYTIAIFFVWFANSYCSATMVASRGMIIEMAVEMVMVYLIFRRMIPKNRKQHLLVASVCISIFFIGYLVAVSQARFGDNSGDSIIDYLGHSMIEFNHGVMTPIHDYGYGKYFFKWLYPSLGINPNLDLAALGCKHGSAFMTFVGCFYIDFGPIGTIILGIICSVLLISFTSKRYYYLSDIIVIAYFASWFLRGALVTARSASLLWLMVFVVYFLVRYLENTKLRIKI